MLVRPSSSRTSSIAGASSSTLGSCRTAAKCGRRRTVAYSRVVGAPAVGADCPVGQGFQRLLDRRRLGRVEGPDVQLVQVDAVGARGGAATRARRPRCGRASVPVSWRVISWKASPNLVATTTARRAGPGRAPARCGRSGTRRRCRGDAQLKGPPGGRVDSAPLTSPHSSGLDPARTRSPSTQAPSGSHQFRSGRASRRQLHRVSSLEGLSWCSAGPTPA
jgi:hypothetical protein